MGYSIGQLAALAHITVRTLHHYDAIGLLTPGGRTAAGYRQYTGADLERLQRILFYRELGFALDQIAALLDAAPRHTLAHLRAQHELIEERVDRLRAVAAAVQKEMEALEMGVKLTPAERFEVFGDFKPEDHDEEVKSRWGDSPAFAESQRRVSQYTKADWMALKAEAASITERLAAAMRAGTRADSPEAMALAEAHRQHISRWFYDCSREMHRGLGEMYVADPRFAKHYEAAAEGLAAYVRDAIVANASRA